MNPYYTDYSEYLERYFPGVKVQKISVNTARSCPNRDGTIGTGGCIYCDNTSFTPSYCREGSDVGRQLNEGKVFFSRKYPSMKYLAYFQSFTPTHSSADALRRDLDQALVSDDVVGAIVAGRPDCMPDEIVDVLSETAKHKTVFVELGVETLHDSTLLTINRGHDSAAVADAIIRLSSACLPIGVHLIEGLPGEDIPMMLDTASRICDMPIDSVKFHQLQVIRGTMLHRLWKSKKLSIHQFSLDSYLDLCVQLVETVPHGIAIERFLASSPPAMVESPRWGIKNHEFTHMLLKRLAENAVEKQQSDK